METLLQLGHIQAVIWLKDILTWNQESQQAIN
jgi:hypothetical protein